MKRSQELVIVTERSPLLGEVIYLEDKFRANSSLRVCNNRKRKNRWILWCLNVYIGAGDEGYLPRGLSNQYF